MGVDIIKTEEGSLSFILTDIDVSLANALRRAVLGEVPSLAIEEVEIYDNTSSLYDEVLTHRLGLIPIATELDILNFRDTCSCKDGCPSCQVEFSLKKKGPGTVYSHDLKPAHKDLVPVRGIPIVKLGKNQRIELKAIAVLGRGKEHTKWQPGVVGYKYHPVIDISEKCNLCGACVDACPKDILTIKRGKLKVTDDRECILCRACVEACEPGAIDVKGDENRFIYVIEATGSLEPREIFTRACDMLIKKAGELTSLL